MTNTGDNHTFWFTVKKHKKQKFVQWNQRQKLGKFYLSLYKNHITMQSIQYLNCVHQFLDSEISIEEQEISINKCKNNKTPGVDEISSEVML